MIDYEKLLPLTPNSDQISMIKLINRRKCEERDVEIQASISSSLLNQILSSCPPCMRKWMQKKLESRELRREVSKQINLLYFQLECLQIRRTPCFYRAFGRNRPIEMIDGYNGTVHCWPFRKCRSHWIWMDGPDEVVWWAL